MSQDCVRLSRAAVRSGQISRKSHGMMISRYSMMTKTRTPATRVAVDQFPVTRLCRAVR